MARTFFRFARSPPRPGREDKEDSDPTTSVVASRSSPDLTLSSSSSPKKEGLSRSSSKSKRLAPWRRSTRLQSPPPETSSSNSQTAKPVAQSHPAIIEGPATPPPQSIAKQTDALPHDETDFSTSRHVALLPSNTTNDDPLDDSFDFIDHPSDIPDIPDPYERPPSRCSSRRSSIHRSPPSQATSLPPTTSAHSSPRNSLIGLPLVAAAAALTENEMDMHIAAASSLVPNDQDEAKHQEKSVFEDDDEEGPEDTAEEDELARLRAYARSVRDFMGMFRMHAAELFDDEYHEQHNRLLEAQQQQQKPQKYVDEFEDASEGGGEEDMEIDEEEPGNSIIAKSSHQERGQLRRVGGSTRAQRGDYDESDSYDEGFEFEYGQVGEEQDYDFEESFSMQSALSGLSGVQQRPRGGSVPLHWRFSELEVIDEEEDEEEETIEPAEPTSPDNNAQPAEELKEVVQENNTLLVTDPSFSVPADLSVEVAEFESSSVPFPASGGIPSPISTPPSSAKSHGPSRPVLTLAMPSSSSTSSLQLAAAPPCPAEMVTRDHSPSPSPNSGSALLTPASTLWQVMTQPRRRRSFAPFPPPKPSTTFQPPNAEKASLSPFGHHTSNYDSQPAVFVVEDTCADDPISPECVASSLQDILVQMKTEKARLENLEHYYTTMCTPERVFNDKTVTLRTQIDALSRAIRQLELASPISPAPGAPVIGSVPLPGSSPISPISPVRTMAPQPSTPQRLSPSAAAKSSPSKSSKLSPSAGASGLQRTPSKGRTSTLSNLDLPPLSPLITLAHNSPSRVPLPKIITETDDLEEPKRGLLFGSPIKPQASGSTTLTPLVSPVRSDESANVDEEEDPFVAAVEQSPISPRLTEAFQVSLSDSSPGSPASNYGGEGASMGDFDDDDETIMPGRRILGHDCLDLPGRTQIKRRAGSLDLKKTIMVSGA
ncbi:hypothetical protein SCHPADRAFT_898529 [Schizopora paradoxa]|uniref:Uncharacterized protein n=1 Tax=Schizopora paradoxa TaxID=27342 RepID=A0A0H2S5P5_9AGAM|nr:hypothetical protein SCHPADRAFT_898529 [Schizopora paradoxa]